MKLFGNNRENHKHLFTNKNKGPQKRGLRFESLESREMLSINPVPLEVWFEVTEKYPDINWAQIGDYNYIEITAEELSDAALRNAINEAATTAENDLIVVRTTATQNKITLDGTGLGIGINAEEYGSVTIVSLGVERLTIDADGESQVFFAHSLADVELIGLTITGGNDIWGGGIRIDSPATLAVTDCIITGNYSSGPGGGGGIYNSYGTLTVTNSKIFGNGAASGGGGVSNFGKLTLSGGEISGNTANYGGGIYNWGELTVTGGEISGNTALVGGGGGISNWGELTLSGSEISGNTANSGGGISNLGELTLSGGEISGNTAQIGGGIYNDGELTLSGGEISRNTAYDFGGGISNWGELTLSGGEISRNTAYESGGGICNIGAGTSTVTGSTISENQAWGEGGGIANWLGATLTVTNSTISKNSGVGMYGGGGIYNQGGKLTVTNSAITENSGRYGGGITSSGVLSVINSEITGNEAAIYGGGIDNWGELTVSGGEISGNTAIRDGGGIYNREYDEWYYEEEEDKWYYKGLATLSNIVIAGNTARDGGGIYNGGTLTLISGTISENTAQYSGGGIDNGGVLTIANSEISGNVVEGNFHEEYGYPYGGYGGGVYNYGELTVTNSEISGNTAFRDGGGIYNFRTLTMTNCEISGNIAEGYRVEQYGYTYMYGGDGGGIYNSGTLTLTSGAISENTAISAGGIYNNGNLTITSGEISKNQAVGYYDEEYGYVIGSTGGGIYNSGTLTLTSGTISENTAIFGGGIFNSGMLTITSSEISRNRVEGYYVEEYGSTYGGSGGGIYNSGLLTITSSVILGNEAYYGGIYNSSQLVVANCTIIKNKAIHGSGIYNDAYDYSDFPEFSYSGTTTLYNTILIENEGDGIENNGGTVQGHHNLTTFGDWNNNGVNFEYDPLKPLFVDAADGDYRLAAGSQVIDKGNNAYVIGTTDRDGDPRVKGTSVDIGAYESEGPVVPPETPAIVVTMLSDFLGPYDGLISLREAILYARDGDTITFAPGLLGQTITLGGNELFLDKNITIDATGVNITIDANQKSRVFSVAQGTTVALVGLTITGGYAYDGGGIYNGGELTVANSVISGNTASYSGGGIYSYGTLTVTNSEISGNRAIGDIYYYYDPELGNYTSIYGGYGGGIYSSGEATITNSTISGNHAQMGAGIYNSDGITTIQNAILAKNTTPQGVENVWTCDDSWTFTEVTHSLFDSTAIPNGSKEITDQKANLLNVDPRFVAIPAIIDETTTGANYDPAKWNLQLQGISPAINKGNNAFAAGTTDLAGRPRIVHDTVDIGAYEYQGITIIPEAPSNIVTTLSDVVDAYDGLISLREAILYASPGAIITFAPELWGKTITLGGSELLIDKNINIDATGADITINANQKSRVMSIGVGSVVTIAGLTITGGYTGGHYAGNGGGILNSGALTITNSAIVDNSGDWGGGIHNNASGVLTVTNCLLSKNMAYGGGGGINNDGELTVIGSTISENWTVDDSDGGGLRNANGTMTVTNSTITKNLANWGGGILNAAGTLTVTNCIITENSATENGGGIANGYVTLTTITSSTISGNIATWTGGGILADGTTTITNSEITGNHAVGDSYYDEEDDRFYPYGGNGGGIFACWQGTLTVINSKIADNSALVSGGGICMEYESIVTLGHTIISGNTAGNDYYGYGGGIDNDGTLTIINCEISNNTVVPSDSSYGGGIYNYGELIVTNSTIAGNEATYGDGVYNTEYWEWYWEGGGQWGIATLYNTIVDDIYNDNGIVQGNNNLTTFTGWTSGSANLVYDSVKPLFVNAAGGNYRLAFNSQAINKGNNAYAQGLQTDLAGKPRIAYGTVDIGAYEYDGAIAVYPTAIINNAANLFIQQGCTLPVTGDGVDPLGKGLKYFWDLGTDDFVEVPGNTTWFSADYPAGQHIIRLKVRDADGNESEIVEASVSILKATPTYSIDGPGELVAGQFLRWEFVAVDPYSPIVEWVIDWGDGTSPTQILGGPRSRVTAWHLYREAKDYTMTISTTAFSPDSTGVTTTVTYSIYVAEPVVVIPEPSSPHVSASGGILTIRGTNGADWIEIEETVSQIIVHAFTPNRTERLEQWSFAKNTISTIEFYGFGGNDTYKNLTTVNDVLDGGDGNNLLLGGKGTTTLKNTGNGSNCFAINGNSVQWAAGSSLGKDDSLILFATVDRYGDSSGWYNMPNDINYVAWSTVNIENVLNTVSSVYDTIGNYAYFRNNNTGNGEIYMMVTNSYSVLGSVYGFNDFGDMVYRENAVNSRLTIHEVGHNWDSLLENPFFDEFAAISYNGNTLKSDAVAGDFAFGSRGIGGYAYEDWAYTISLVFDGYGTNNQSTSAPATEKYLQKVDVIHRFGAWLGGAISAPLTASVHTSDRYAEFWISGFDSTLSYKLYYSDASGNKGADTGATLTNSWINNNVKGNVLRVTGLEPGSTTHYLLEATNSLDETVSSGVLTATTHHGLSVGDPLDLSDARTLDNEAVNWNALLSSNRYIVVAFVAPWCPYSVEEIDYLMEYVYDTYKPKGLEIISAYIWDTVSEYKAQVAKKGIPWINITDSYLNISYDDYYGITGVPTTVVVDCASGKIISNWVSASYLATLNWNAPSPAPGSMISTAMHVSCEIDDPGLTETMRRRLMLDLDQSGRKVESVAFPELVWNDELFGDEWLDFSEQKSSDFWSEVFDEDLLMLETVKAIPAALSFY